MSEGRLDEVSVILCRQLELRTRFFGASSPAAVSVFNAFGVMLRKEGQFANARRLLEELTAVAQNYGPEGTFLRRVILQNLGTALYAQGYFESSESILRRSLALAEESGDVSSRDIGSTLTNLAFALEAQSRYSDAEAYHRRAADLRSVGAPRHELAASLNNLGANLTAQGQYDEAEPLLKESLSIRETTLGAENLNVGFSLANLAINALRGNRPDEAARYAERLVDLRQGALGDAHPETAIAYQVLANAYLELRDYSGALRAARKALEGHIPATQREAAAVSDDARASLRAEAAPVALVFVRAAWELSKSRSATWSAGHVPALADEAFSFAQRIPVSSTADAFSRAASLALASNRGLNELATEYTRTEDARFASDLAMANAISMGASVDAQRSARIVLDRRLSTLERELTQRFPTFFAFARPDPIDISRLTSMPGALGDDDVLVLMTPGQGEARGVVWAVTRRDGGAWAEIALDADELYEAISTLRLRLDLAAGYDATNAIDGDPADFDLESAHSLYEALFGAPGVATILPSKKNWILVPQGSLVSLPFAALVMSPPSARGPTVTVAERLRAARWLGLHHTLSIMPSTASLTTRSTPAQLQREQFFGVGDPTFKGAASDKPLQISEYFGERGGRVDTIRDLPALPGTRLEIEGIARLLNAGRNDYLLGSEASETELRKPFRRAQLARATTVAFATHGIVSGELRGSPAIEPALALSPPPSPRSDDDGLLTSSEVAQLTLNADLVLLSACRTAAGNRLGGEELTGLARAFFASGARSLLVSHWRVRDDVASRFTVRVVELMQSSRPTLSAAAAARTSMAELVADPSSDHTSISFSHPAVWAAFAIVGWQ